jgi:predicted NAD-dependent protein-ADP-ribosyltransferase YbiA (DUF1768 family)
VEKEGSAYRTSQTRPSVATCFLVASSDLTSCWRVAESPGEASCLSRIFCGFCKLQWLAVREGGMEVR